MYFLDSGLGYVISEYDGPYGVLLQRSTLGEATLLYQQDVSLMPNDVWVHDTVPQFQSCAEADTITFRLFVDSDTDRVHVVLHQIPVGIEEPRMSDVISIYPNPVIGSFCIEQLSQYLGAERFTIHSADGRLVKQGLLNGSVTHVDVVDLRSGVYVVEMEATTGGGRQRILVL
jgi:hypothetical protein